VGAGPREDPGIVAVAASRVEDLAAAQIADEGQEGRVVQELAGDVVALPDFPGPRGRVVVPVARDFLEGELERVRLIDLFGLAGIGSRLGGGGGRTFSTPLREARG
jgi:hypothetical protein